MSPRIACSCLAACAFGCMSYSAQIDRRVVRGDVAAHVESVRSVAGRDMRMTLVVEEAPPNVRLVNATVGHQPAALCEAGHYAQAIGRDAARSVDAPLARGERLTLGYSSAAFDALATDEQPRLDLLLATPLGAQRCVTIPLSDRGPLAWEPVERWTFGIGLSLEGFTSSLGAVAQIVTAPIEVGLWLGDYHLELGAGIGGAGCEKGLCEAPSEEQQIDYATIFPLYFGVRRTFISWDSKILGSNEAFGLGLGLRYRAMKLAADTFAGRQELWMHGPVLVPYYGLLGVRTEGFAQARSPAVLTLDVPVGYAIAENGERAVSLGFNLALFFTVL